MISDGNRKNLFSKCARAVLAACLCAVLLVNCACTAPDGHTDTAGRTAVPGTDQSNSDGMVPVFSSPGGLYSGPVNLSLSIPSSAPSGAYITYTLNGDEPDADSTVAKGSLDIQETTAVRAALFSKDGVQLGTIITNTYIVSDSTDLRIVALTADTDDLYSEASGIFANRSGSGSEWERPASVEIYEPDGTVLIHQDAGLRLAGSGSRSFDPASLRLIARKSDKFDETGIKYSGSGKFEADLFGTGFTGYDRFLLRNGGNDSPYQARKNFLRMNLLRDCITNEYCALFSENTGISVFAQHCIPVCVYLNGEYYGMSVMKEDFDERLLSEQYGLEKEQITVIKGKKLYYQVESGAETELDRWLELCEYAIDHALSDDYAEAYEYVSKCIDTDNAAAYLAVMLYLCNTDWPQNNAMVWRYTGDKTDCTYSDGRWRFVIRDMDLCFALHDEASRVSKTTYTMADTDTFYRLLVFYREGNGYSFDESTGLYADEMKLQGLFDFLLRSAEFRDKFVALCGQLQSAAEAANMESVTESFRLLATDEMRRHIEFWKARCNIYSSYTFSCWEDSFDDMREFISQRPQYFAKYLEETLKYYE